MTKRPVNVSAASACAAHRARRLIEQMLKELQRNLRDPACHTPEEWERLFGSRQSMVVNLQKLVAALAALPEDAAASDGPGTQAAITPEEMKLLTQWLKEGDG